MSTRPAFAAPLNSQSFASNLLSAPSPSTPAESPTMFFQAIFESMMHGVLILNEKREVIQANRRALTLCQQINLETTTTRSATTTSTATANTIAASTANIPEAVWTVCRALLSSREEFSEYQVIPEEDIEIGQEMGQETQLKIYAQWLDVNDAEESYMLVTLEDRTEMLRNLARWDVRRYGLTSREAEVWMLKCQNYSYDEIAAELYISRNTVKKHLKSISMKRGNEVD